MERRRQKRSEKAESGHTWSKIDIIGRKLLRKQRLFQSCSADEEEEEISVWVALCSLNQCYSLLHSVFSRTVSTCSMTSSPATNISTLVMSLRDWYVTRYISIIKCNLCTVRTSHIRPFNIATLYSTSPLKEDDDSLKRTLSFLKERAPQWCTWNIKYLFHDRV